MRRARTLCMLLALAAAMVGCAGERKLAVSRRTPQWVRHTPPDTEEALIFVGTAIGDNILDERAARNRAMEDVRTQIADSIETRVLSQAREIVEQEGAAHRGKDVDSGTYSRMVEQKVGEIIPGVRQEDFYWEKWKIDPGILRREYRKYKYYVKAAIPRELYSKLQTELTHQIADEMQGGGE